MPLKQISTSKAPSAIGPYSQGIVANGFLFTAGQIALAWLLAQQPWIVPIPGTTKVSRLHENIGAARVQLDANELRSIDEALAKVPVQGERYPAQLQSLVGR